MPDSMSVAKTSFMVSSSSFSFFRCHSAIWLNGWLPMWYNNLGLFIIISNITPRSHNRNAEYSFLGKEKKIQPTSIHNKFQYSAVSPPLLPSHAVWSSVGALYRQLTPRLKVTTLHCAATCMTGKNYPARYHVNAVSSILWFSAGPKGSKKGCFALYSPSCSSYKPWFLLFPFLLQFCWDKYATEHLWRSGALQCLHTQWEPMQGRKERMFCRNVIKSGVLGCGYRTCWKSNFPTHYVGESQHFQSRWGGGIYTLYTESNKWPSFIGNHWHFQKHLIWCLKWHSMLC